MKKILVTGYNGFIGHNLVTDLLSKKYQVIGLSNKKERKRLDVIQMQRDIRKLDKNDLPKDISSIIHLAAITDLSYCQENPSECIEINVGGTQNMLEIARKIGAKFLYLSTSHVYGVPKKLPITEDHPKNPTSIYAGSKLAGEVLCESYARSYGMDISVARLFSVYGPYSPPHLVISRIISQLLSKKIISIGNSYPKRDFIFIKDVVNAIKILLEKQSGYQVYNIGSGKSYSILKICEILNSISGAQKPIKSINRLSRKHDVSNVVSDCSKLRKTGWKPKIRIDDGLELNFNWQKDYL